MSIITDGYWLFKVAFIKQEAQEKAREVKVKADEEFAIEKVSLSMFLSEHDY